MSDIPWDQSGADPLADIAKAIRLSFEAPYPVFVPVVSPRCGQGRHPGCRSAICECTCHHPMQDCGHSAYSVAKISGVGVVCLECDTTWEQVPDPAGGPFSLFRKRTGPQP